MSLPTNTARILKYLGHDLNEIDVMDSYGVVTIARWDAPTIQPTEQEIIDAGNSQGFADWLVEHGGDATLTARRRLKEVLDDPTGKVIIALVKVLIDQGVITATPQQVRDAVIAKITAGEAD